MTKTFTMKPQTTATAQTEAREGLPTKTVEQTVSQSKKVKVTFLLDDTLRDSWKQKAIKEKMTVTDMLITAMKKTYGV